MNDIDDIIMGGMVFKAGGGPKKEDDGKVKTKAKKKKYITGAHGNADLHDRKLSIANSGPIATSRISS